MIIKNLITLKTLIQIKMNIQMINYGFKNLNYIKTRYSLNEQ